MIFDLYDEVGMQALDLVCQRILDHDGNRGKPGLVAGAWDCLHMNHVRALKEFRFLCDFLIVGVGTDRLVQENKGPDRPLIPHMERTFLISELKCVDACFIMDSERDYQKVADAFITPYRGVHFKSIEWANRAEDVPGFDPDYVYDAGPRKTVSQIVGNVILLNYGRPGTISTSSFVERLKKE